MDFKTPLANISVSIIIPPNSYNELRLFAFSTPVPIDITILREITTSAKRIPIITSLIFTIISSLTLSCLPALVNCPSLDSGFFVTFFFQLFTVLRLNSCCECFELKRFLAAYAPSHKLCFPCQILCVMECLKHKCFPLFWIEVTAFSSLLIASESANVTCCDDSTTWGVEFTLRFWAFLLSFIAFFCFQWAIWP